MIVVCVRGGRSSVGRASVCGTGGRQFDPGRSPGFSENIFAGKIASRGDASDVSREVLVVNKVFCH